MNLAELDRILTSAGHQGVFADVRTSFHGATMSVEGDRGAVDTTTFASEDAMCRWVLARELVRRAPRPDAVVHTSLIAPIAGASHERVQAREQGQEWLRALWQVSYPVQSMLRARGDGLLAVLDTSGLSVDPERGAPQITILDALTGAVQATWIPPHAAMWPRFDNGTLFVDDGDGTATVCDILTGRVLGSTQSGVRATWAEPLLPQVLHRGQDVSRLEAPDGTLLWKRPGWVRPAARAHGLSIINNADATVVEAVRDDGTTVWTTGGIPATVTADTVWIDAGPHLRIVDTKSGEELSCGPAPWGSDKLYALHTGWDEADGVVVISGDTTLAAYPGRPA